MPACGPKVAEDVVEQLSSMDTKISLVAKEVAKLHLYSIDDA
jgi:hypothetical protein